MFLSIVKRNTKLKLSNIIVCSFNSSENVVISKKRKKWDITDTMYPGIYKMYDQKNNKSYYGECKCLCPRYVSHLRELRLKVHHNPGLLKAYQEQNNPDGFRFFILESGSEWADRKKRLKCQDEYIANNRSNCYNIDQSLLVKRMITPIMVKGVRYYSEREAVRLTKISRSTLRRFLKDPEKPEIYPLIDERQPYGCIPVFGQKNDGPSVLFRSFNECIEAGYATNHQNLRRKIKRREVGWRYAHVYTNGTPIRSPYILKPGEISYEQLT